MSTISPSKYISTARLEQIKRDHCIAACGKEYTEHDLNELLMEKYQKKADEQLDKNLKELTEFFENAPLDNNHVPPYASLIIDLKKILIPKPCRKLTGFRIAGAI